MRRTLSSIFDAAGLAYTPENIDGGKWATPGPVGIVVHHQVGLDEIGSDGALSFVKYGPIAPYYNVWHNYGDGHRHIITEGEANHAGYGDPAHINRISAGAPVDDLLPRNLSRSDSMVGNAWLIGVCLEGPDRQGGHTQVQYDATVETCAAICDAYGWHPAVNVMGHKEWATPRGRKSDPGFDMGKFRQDVGDQMALPADVEQWVVDLHNELKALGWKDGSNSAKRLEYANRLRNGLVARTGVGGDNGAAIADALALLSDVVSNGGTGVVLGETYTVTLGDLSD